MVSGVRLSPQGKLITKGGIQYYIYLQGDSILEGVVFLGLLQRCKLCILVSVRVFRTFAIKGITYGCAQGNK